VHVLLRREEGLEKLDRGGTARFDLVDFGKAGAAMTQLNLEIAAKHPGRLELWVDGDKRLAAFDIAPTRGVTRTHTAPIEAANLEGTHSVLLKVVSGKDIGRLSTLELR